VNSYKSEEEQVEDIKKWLKTYAPPIIIGILIAILATNGWKYWQTYVSQRAANAAAIYAQMINADAAHATTELTQAATILTDKFARTPYAEQARFMLGKQAALKKAYPEAIKQLKLAMKHTKQASLKQVARIRIARIELEQKQAQKALKTLKTVEDKHFLGQINALRGDAWQQSGNPQKARQAYTQAITALGSDSPLSSSLQMKLDQLPQATRGT
jgi:predicted negative regulator of RcsB-dependent stress response